MKLIILLVMVLVQITTAARDKATANKRQQKVSFITVKNDLMDMQLLKYQLNK